MGASTRVLILDDNVDVAESLGEILELSGYAVTLAYDGETAVSLFCSGEFDVGLFDVKMPGMNGVEAFLSIRSQKPQATVLFMSGYADEGLLAKAMTNGAAGLLPKPFEADDMLEALRNLARHQMAHA